MDGKTRSQAQNCLAGIVLFLAACVSQRSESSPSGEAGEQLFRPNILWLIAEDLGPELGCYGTEQVWTPAIDRLAQEGLRFTRAFTVTPVCSTSRSSFMTGMYATSIGAHNHRSHRRDGYRLPKGVRVLTDRLRAAGYYTANLRDLGSREKPRFYRGTGKTDWNFHYEGKPFDGARWSELPKDRPWYAQINFAETHRGRAWNRSHTVIDRCADPSKVVVPPYYPEHPLVRKDWAQYLNTVMSLDKKVAFVLSKLEEEGLLEKTIVVFLGDHGRAMVRGKQWCYDSGLHVPLLIRYPKPLRDRPGHEPGTVDGRLIASIDLCATTLAWAGVRKPRGMQGKVFDGTQREPERRYVFGTRDRCDETVFRIRTIRTARFRYIRNFMPERPFLQLNRYKERSYPVLRLMRRLHAEGKLDSAARQFFHKTRPSEELYDLDRDPYEMRNLAREPEFENVRNELRQALDSWIRSSGDLGRTAEPKSVTDYWEQVMRARDNRRKRK